MIGVKACDGSTAPDGMLWFMDPTRDEYLEALRGWEKHMETALAMFTDTIHSEFVSECNRGMAGRSLSLLKAIREAIAKEEAN